MEDKLAVGMYVRTKWGIAKIIDYEAQKLLIKLDKEIMYENLPEYYDYAIIEDVLNASHNIIDLIEVGDYVNGERVIALKKDISERKIHINSKGNSIFVDYDLADDWYYGIDDEDIKLILTKEQCESMSYKVGEINE